MGVDEASFCGCYAFSCGDDFALGSNHSSFIREGANEIDFDFQSSVGHARGKRGVNGAAHAGIEQGGGVSAVDCAQRIIEFRRGMGGEDHPALGVDREGCDALPVL